MKKIAALLAVLVSLAVCADAGAATYYVAQADPKASDDNSGAEVTPWKTIVRSLKTLQPGDTLYIKKGTYREYVLLTSKARDGFPAFPSGKNYQDTISFVAFPGDEVMIKGSDELTGWKQDKDRSGDGKIWYREDFPKPFLPTVYCDNKRLQLIGDWGGKVATDILKLASFEVWLGKVGEKFEDMKPGSCFFDKATSRAYVWLPDGSDPNRHLLEVNHRECFQVQTDFVRLSGLRILQGSASLGGKYGVMEDCEVSDAPWCNFGLGGRFNTVLRCKFNRGGDTGMGGAGVGHRIIDCETMYNNFLGISSGWHAGAIKMIANAHNILFSGLHSAYNTGDGIWFDSGNSEITIENCVLHNNTCSGVFYEISERATIRNNVMYENGSRGVYLSNSGDCQVIGNIFYHNGMSGVASIGVNRPYAPYNEGDNDRVATRNNVIWGNIFVDNCHPDFCLKTLDGRDKPWGTRAELILPDENPLNTGNVSDYNIYYRTPGRVMPFWKGWHLMQCKDIDEWRTKTGNDKHSIVAEPLFVNAAKFDFHPAKGSPAIGFVQPRMAGHMAMDYQWRPMRERADKKPIFYTAGPFEFEGEK